VSGVSSPGIHRIARYPQRQERKTINVIMKIKLVEVRHLGKKMNIQNENASAAVDDDIHVIWEWKQE